MFRTLATAFKETLWPTRCIGCEMPGTLLCAECRSRLPYIDARAACPRCGAPWGMTVCTECGNGLAPRDGAVLGGRGAALEFPFSRARSALSYEGVARRLLGAYKDRDEVRLDATIAALICQAMRGETRSAASLPACQRDARLADWTRWADALVAVPTSAEALARRGFDHMGRVGRLCAEYAGLPRLDALVHARRVADQRGLGAGERAENLRGSFAVAAGVRTPLPARIVLVDDVFTTGATLSAAAEALLSAGAREVVAATCARVW